MLQLQPPELLLHLAYFCEVCFHVLVLRLVHLVGEVDEELLITLDVEVLHPQCCCSFQARYEALVFCYVVGDLLALLETELYDIVELVLSG